MSERVTLSGDQLTAYLTARPYLAVENIPYADDLVDKYQVPGWGSLTTQIEDPLTPKEQIGTLRTERAKLFMEAVHHSDVYFGPVREREVVLPPVDAPPIVDTKTNPLFDEKDKDWKITKTVKGHLRNLESLGKVDKSTALMLLGVGIMGGFTSVAMVHGLVTEPIMQQLDVAHAPWLLKLLTGSTVTIAGNWALNQKLFLDTVIRKWTMPNFSRDWVEEQVGAEEFAKLGVDIQAKMLRDGENKFVASVVVGDIVGKILGGISMAAVTAHMNHLHQMITEPAVQEIASGTDVPAPVTAPAVGTEVVPQAAQPAPPLTEPYHVPTELDGVTGTPIVPTEILTTHAIPTGWVEHVITENDIIDNLLGGGEFVYSQDMIHWFDVNHDQMIGIWQKMAAANPQHLVPVEMGADSHMEYWTIDQMDAKYNWLLKHGFKAGDIEAQAWIERFTKWATPGSTILLPPKP